METLYGVTRTREVYEKAIEVLPDDSAKNMCLEYAELERKLGEVRVDSEQSWGEAGLREASEESTQNPSGDVWW